MKKKFVFAFVLFVLFVFGLVKIVYAVNWDDVPQETSCPTGTVSSTLTCRVITPARFDWSINRTKEIWSEYPLSNVSFLSILKPVPGFYTSGLEPCYLTYPYLHVLWVSSWNRALVACGKVKPPVQQAFNLSCKGEIITPKKISGKDYNVMWTAVPSGVITPKTFTWDGHTTGQGSTVYDLVHKGESATVNIKGTAVDSQGKIINSTNISDGTNACSVTVPLDKLSLTCEAKLVAGKAADGTATNVRFTAKNTAGQNTAAKSVGENFKYVWGGGAINASSSSVVDVYVPPGQIAEATINGEAEFKNFDKPNYVVKSSNTNNSCKIKVKAPPTPNVTCDGKVSSENENTIEWTATVKKNKSLVPENFSYSWEGGSVSSSSLTKIPDDVGVNHVFKNQVVVKYPDAPDVISKCTLSVCPTLSSKLKTKMSSLQSRALKDTYESGEVMVCFKDGTVKGYKASVVSGDTASLDLMPALQKISKDLNKNNGIYSITHLHNHPIKMMVELNIKKLASVVLGNGFPPSTDDFMTLGLFKSTLGTQIKYYGYVLDGERNIWDYDIPVNSDYYKARSSLIKSNGENLWVCLKNAAKCDFSRSHESGPVEDYLKASQKAGLHVNKVSMP